MKRITFPMVVVFVMVFIPWLVQAQVSPVRLKVSKHQKSDTKTNYQSSDGSFRSGEKNKTIYYTIDLTNVSGGAAKDFTVKWAVLVKTDRSTWINGEWRRGESKVVQGEKSCTLEFAKSTTFDTDVIELSGWETVSDGYRQTHDEAKVAGYAVEVFCNDQRVAADIQPADTKAKIDQLNNTGDQKRHQF